MLQYSKLDLAALATALTALFGLAFLLAREFYMARIVASEFAGIAAVGIFAVSVPVLAAAGYGLILRLWPLPPGTYSADEVRGPKFLKWKVAGLFTVFSVNVLVQTNLLLFPFRAPFYRLMSARIGKNCMLAGIFLDPHFVKIGDGVVIGPGVIISGHSLDIRGVKFAMTVIGNDVAIGGNSCIYQGCTFGDGAAICAGSVVLPNTEIPAGELWGGNPARCLRPARKPDLRAVSNS